MTQVARLELLGGFRLSAILPDAGARTAVIAAKKNRALLGILAMSPGLEATRDRLVGLLWGERREVQARNSLRQALVALRKDFATIGIDHLVLNGDGVALDASCIAVDVLELLAVSAAVAEHVQAAALYRGPFLDGLTISDEAFEGWLREARSDLALRALRTLSALATMPTFSSKPEPPSRKPRMNQKKWAPPAAEAL